MSSISEFLGDLGLGLPTVAILLAVIAGWVLASWAVARAYRGSVGKRLPRQLLQLTLSALALLLLLLFGPLPSGLRSELINLIGIVLSATIALSSTTFLSNAMAGVMLRAVRNFKTGDLIHCGDHKGRVSERGLLHVEIQSEESDLITLPNLFLVTQPVRVTKEAGTIISADVSLGYDVPRERIEELLLAAAHEVGLEKPFVWILELTDFSVVYRVAGMLRPAHGVLSSHSRLRAAMLDNLHQGQVEIVSPTFMNTRQLPLESTIIPPEEPRAAAKPSALDKPEAPEELVFSKAKQAASLEKQQEELDALDEEIGQLEEQLSTLPEGSERNGTAARLERRRREREHRAALLARRQDEAAQRNDE